MCIMSMNPKADIQVRGAALARALGQLQPFVAAFPHECVGQLCIFWGQPTCNIFLARSRKKSARCGES